MIAHGASPSACYLRELAFAGRARTRPTRHNRATRNAMGNTATTTAPGTSVFISSSIIVTFLLAAACHHRSHGRFTAKDPGEFRAALAVQFHHITHRNTLEQVLHI